MINRRLLHPRGSSRTRLTLAPVALAPAALVVLLGLSALSGCAGDQPIDAAETTTTTTVPAPPTTRATTTTSTTTTTTTLFPPPPEQPDAPIAPPRDARGQDPYVEMGAIEIPSIDVSSQLLQGIRLTTLDVAPGHWPGSALPGRVGNSVISGHRTSHGGVFRNLDKLEAGDEILVHAYDGTHTYRVTEIEIVPPTALWIVDPTPTATITLFACHPPGSTRERIVVRADLVET
jgi:sortase A